MIKKYLLLVSFLLLVSLTACSGGEAGGNAGDPPARAVEAYLSAKIQGDQDGIRTGLCSEMEATLERELHTFDSVTDAAIENMSCVSDDPAAAAETTVRCEGEIVALYGTEETNFPLSAYRAVNEDGEWKWCGETE